MTQGRNFTAEQIEMLRTKPNDNDYEVRPDGQTFLPIQYFRNKANEIFGAGRWSWHSDAASVVWRIHNHPTSGKVIGEMCYIQVTVTVEGCQPISTIGYAPVQFSKDRGSGELAPNQQISQYALAVRSAAARGLKDALACFGEAFVADLRGQKERKTRGNNYQARPVSVPQAMPVIAERPKVEVEKREPATAAKPRPTLEVALPAQEKANESAAEATENSAKISPEQLTDIEKLATSKGYSINGVLNQAKKLYGEEVNIEKLADLTQPQANNIIERLKKVAPKKSDAA